MLKPRLCALALAITAPCVPALAQSLMTPRAPMTTPPPVSNPQGAAGSTPGPTFTSAGNPELRSMSMMYLEPPRPRIFQLHDQITIIIDETSKQQSSQTIDTKKDSQITASLDSFPSLAALLDGELRTGGSSPVVEGGLSGNTKYKGEGKYDRSDRFSARVTATVIDVKPNGVLALEARKTIIKDEEETTIVLAGSCRSEDVSPANTVLSTQLANLTVASRNTGLVKDTADKGWITRVFEAIFNF